MVLESIDNFSIDKKPMNKISIIAICILLTTTHAFDLIGPMRKVTDSNGLTAVERHGRLTSVNGKVVNQYGAIPQLNGMSMFWSQWMGKYWNADVINWFVSDWKVTVIRAAMGVNQGGYLENPDAEKAKMVAVIDAAIKNGIYVICDWHIEGQNKGNVDRSKDFFTQMSSKYGSYKHVLCEGWNEPTQQDWSSEIKPYHQQILQTIRAHSQTLYIAGSSTWSQDAEKACGDKITGDNVAYTLHFYVASHGADLRGRAENAMNNGCALFITEWGTCEASGNGRVDTGSVTQWLDWAKSHGIGTANWGFEDKAESCAALSPNAASNGGWNDGQLSESGRFVRGYLRGFLLL